MKSVLISIQPKWCAKIASGEKTIEVRKTAPKIQPPFKCYIYETQGKTEVPWMDEDGHMIFRGRGMVIGEFTCEFVDFLDEWNLFEGMDEVCQSRIEEFTCLSIDELLAYKGNRQEIYGWCISELKIYDKPKQLCEFVTANSQHYCHLHRPPQSWCYVDAPKGE